MFGTDLAFQQRDLASEISFHSEIITKGSRPKCFQAYGVVFFLLARTGTGSPRGGDSHMKVTGMLVVSRRGVNCRFWSRSGFTGRKANFFYPYRYRLGLCVKKYLYEKPNAVNLQRQS